jgi:hypothetical protein
MDRAVKASLEYFEAGLSRALEIHDQMEEHLNDPALAPELRKRVRALFDKTSKLIVETAEVIELLESKVSARASLN